MLVIPHDVSRDVIARAGEIWSYQGKRFVCHGTQNKGRYLYSPELKGFCGRTYVCPDKCVKILQNEGIVVKNSRESGK